MPSCSRRELGRPILLDRERIIGSDDDTVLADHLDEKSKRRPRFRLRPRLPPHRCSHTPSLSGSRACGYCSVTAEVPCRGYCLVCKKREHWVPLCAIFLFVKRKTWRVGFSTTLFSILFSMRRECGFLSESCFRAASLTFLVPNPCHWHDSLPGTGSPFMVGKFIAHDSMFPEF